MENTKKILDIAVEVAYEAGDIVSEAFNKPHDVEFKGDVNPVTEIDRESEAHIVQRLQAAFPDHHILAEEEGGDALHTPGAIWIIDPVDGTNNFAHNFPHIGISIALVVDGTPHIGIIYDPLRDELFAARLGAGATLNDAPIHVSEIPKLANAFLATGFPYDRRVAEDNNVHRFDNFLRRSQGVRRAGAAVLDLAYVACGRFDGFWELGLSPWDVAAGILIIQESGGRVTDFGGTPLPLNGEQIVASNAQIHEAMLRVIREGNNAPHPDFDPDQAL